MSESVIVKLLRKDILAFHLYLFPRLRGNWIFLGLLFLALFALLLLAERPAGTREYLIAALSSAIGALLGWVAALYANYRKLARRLDQPGGMPGVYRFTLEPDGLHEHTNGEDTVYNWTAVRSLRKTAQFIVVSVGAGRHILIPRREFPDRAAFDRFYDRAAGLLGRERKSNA